MDWVVIVTVLALLQYFWFGVEVGAMRGKNGVKAPATSGAPEFERRYRVHYNTLEQLVLFLPLLWLFAHYVNPLWAAGLGAVFIVGRFIYRAAYVKEPASRGVGFTITFLPSAVMAVWLLYVAVMNLL
ncbi:MAG: MAPEG family protein [Woeseiaceae bacterium]|nr:MAPEG family protein [Woeseiaceae bacterium]